MHNVAGNAYRDKIKIAGNFFERDIILFGKSLYQFKANPTARKFFIRILTIGPFGIEYGYGFRQFLSGKVVVADNKINRSQIRVSNFINRFDAAVKCYDQAKPIFGCIVYPIGGYAISFAVTVGYIIFYIIIYLFEKTINQRYGRSTVDVIITIN